MVCKTLFLMLITEGSSEAKKKACSSVVILPSQVLRVGIIMKIVIISGLVLNSCEANLYRYISVFLFFWFLIVSNIRYRAMCLLPCKLLTQVMNSQ